MRRPARLRTPRQPLAWAVPIAVLVLAVAVPEAMASTFAPETGGSPNADRIRGLYDVALWIALVIFVGVEGALLYSVIKFRGRRGTLAAQIRGNTRLEIGWTVGAAVVLVILAVMTFAKLSSIRDPDNAGPGGYRLASNSALAASNGTLNPPNGRALHIRVNGQQYLWRFTYPGGGPTGLGAPYSYEEMVVPTNTTVVLDIVSQDVAHSWWVPKLGGKFDAIPGFTNHTWFRIPRPAIYEGQCAELCGRNHADMVARVRAVTPGDFQAWLTRRQADIAAANRGAALSRGKLNAQTGAQSVQSP